MKKTKITLAALLAVLILSGCTSVTAQRITYKPEMSPQTELAIEHIKQPKQTHTETAQTTVSTEPEAEAPSQTTAQPSIPLSTEDAINGFAFSLYDELYSDGKNVFFSPYSISTALSMLDNGAQNNTKAELEAALGISDISAWNENINGIAKFDDKKIKFLPANSIWINDEKKGSFDDRMNSEFIAPLTKFYNAEIFTAKFSDNSITSKVNSWISDKTNKKIDKMLDNINKDTTMLVINAVYFEGEWSIPFERNDTHSQMFYGSDGGRSVDMMSKSGTYMKYTEVNGMKGIRMPYGSGSVAMDIFIADDDSSKSASEIFSGMTADERAEMFRSLSSSEENRISYLAIPKFKFDGGNIELADPLKNLGIKDAFDEYNADLDIIGTEIFVSKVTHKAVIEVDEMGSKAAAATIIETKDNAMSIIGEDDITFVADRPFVFTITDTETGTILFIGTINNL